MELHTLSFFLLLLPLFSLDLLRLGTSDLSFLFLNRDLSAVSMLLHVCALAKTNAVKKQDQNFEKKGKKKKKDEQTRKVEIKAKDFLAVGKEHICIFS